jgi:dTDP-4-dehydrorhamnose reductase
MRILILGGRGMAGHMIKDYLMEATNHEVWDTVRGPAGGPCSLPLDATNESHVLEVLEKVSPDVVINAVGILNEEALKRPKEAIYVNSLLPHLLADFGERLGFRLIHISTDCVFSGKKGNYTETDIPDGISFYAKTKSAGEIIDEVNLTIRTSIVGPELKPDGIGLFHWFMGQSGAIKGFSSVFWNGVTTLELAKAIEWTLEQDIRGLIHLAGPTKVSKHTLLNLFKTVFERPDISIQPYDAIESDKSLVNTRSDFSYQVPCYVDMISELKKWMERKGREVYPYA